MMGRVLDKTFGEDIAVFLPCNSNSCNAFRIDFFLQPYLEVLTLCCF